MTRGDCPTCDGTGLRWVNGVQEYGCPDCDGTGLSAESLDAFREEVDALSRAALAPWPPEDPA